MSENKFTPRAEEVLRLSQEAAEDLGHGYVGSEHLLLGLIREEEGIAHRVLSEFGVTDEMDVITASGEPKQLIFSANCGNAFLKASHTKSGRYSSGGTNVVPIG